jgi:peptide subunit release factor 1 (eRF1)
VVNEPSTMHLATAMNHPEPTPSERWSATGSSCPMDAAELQPQENIVDHAVERALSQSIEVLIFRDHRSELERHGSIAALLRY